MHCKNNFPTLQDQFKHIINMLQVKYILFNAYKNMIFLIFKFIMCELDYRMSIK